MAILCIFPQTHFNAISELEAHSTQMHNRPVKACSRCPAVFVSEMGLAQHSAQAHSGQTVTPAKCDVCSATFPSTRKLSSHKVKVSRITLYLLFQSYYFTSFDSWSLKGYATNYIYTIILLFFSVFLLHIMTSIILIPTCRFQNVSLCRNGGLH